MERSAAVGCLGMALGTTPALTRCGGGASAPSMTPAPLTVTVNTSPTFAALALISEIQQFTATVDKLSPS